MIAGRPIKYEGGAKHVTLSCNGHVLEQFQKIMAREGSSASEGFTDYISNYIKVHGSGNPSYEITQWIDNKDFRAIPTLLSGREKWDKYLSECQVPELVSIAGAAHLVERIATQYWKEKKNTLPGPKTGLEEIQEALNKERENRA